MKNWKKLAMTAGAVSALGVAGTFGTFSAFTAAAPDYQTQFKTGSVKIDNEFALPTLSNMGTQDAASAGYIKFTNTGTKPINVWVDFDGPTGNITNQSNGVPVTDDPLVDNIIVDSSYDPNFSSSSLLDSQTRLFRINNRGLSPLPDPANPASGPLVLAPGDSRALYFRAGLRHRIDGGDDNANQLKAITETIHVKAIEAGATDFGSYGPQPADGGN